jgi:hypothetical protein
VEGFRGDVELLADEGNDLIVLKAAGVEFDFFLELQD